MNCKLEDLPGAVAVVKNLLLAGQISRVEAANLLWDLVIEFGGDSVYYREGSSRTIDRFLKDRETIRGR